VAETIWLSPEVANDNQVIGGDDGVGGYAPLAVAVGSGTGLALHWVHGNHLGVPIVTTNSSGAAITPSGYTMPGFPGQTRTLSDLYYNRHRDYDSSTGRYIQADPIGLEGGSNPYLYAEGNPLRYTDPLGLNPAAAALLGPVLPEVFVIGSAFYASYKIGGIIGNAIGDAIIAARNCPNGDFCYIRWEREDSHCSRWSYLGGRAMGACRVRAATRRDLCIRNGGRPNPLEPNEWDPLKDWYDDQRPLH